jgi:hypothetical protein
MLNKLDPTSSVTGSFNPHYCEPSTQSSVSSSSVTESSIESREPAPASYPNDLQKQIQQLFLPYLAQIFQQKACLHVSPTRLHNAPETSPEMALANLQKLQQDLKETLEWVQVCLKQTEKALREKPRYNWLNKFFR